jgi:hypothetical protein
VGVVIEAAHHCMTTPRCQQGGVTYDHVGHGAVRPSAL